ncbi:MAG: UvrD-helicase domain-containing protein, partial [Solirubrobacteraceae bacterium]
MSDQTAGPGADPELHLLSGAAAADRPLDGLEAIQRDAATHSVERLVVLGAAGTGKTRVVEARFRWLVATGAAAERIALVVPSAGRAAALRARIEVALQEGYEQLHVVHPAALATLVLRGGGAGSELDPSRSVLGAGDRLALLVERIDELSLRHHDIGGRPSALLGAFVRRIDRLKAQCVGAEQYAEWAATLDGPEAELEREFAEVYRSHERLLREAGARDGGDLLLDALALARRSEPRFDHLLIDDAQELDQAPAQLALAVGARRTVTIAGDGRSALRRFRGDGTGRMRALVTPDAQVVVLDRVHRSRAALWQAATAALAGLDAPDAGAAQPGGEVHFW